ncbi:MAG: Gfo/Idh/MocA family oxidoreductase [Ruminococcaceae bacterium]|nr:Gfo/Idh/MocA family oxidoreductase [Oscillospiraceae bacterium]
MLKVGVIGYGGRIRDMLKEFLKTGKVEVLAVCDVDPAYARKNADENGVGEYAFYTDAREMLEKEALDGVLVGTRCSLHTEYACLVASYGIPLFLEKPVATTREQEEQLKSILYHSDKTVVSFPLRVTDIVLRVKEIIESGRIGKLSQVQAVNNVPYGRVYFHGWYRDESETGGLFLQKSTHDFDYINSMLDGARPTSVSAVASKVIFTGDEPAGQLCESCPKRDTCPEGPDALRKLNIDPAGYGCCFARDTGNHDSGSALVTYDTGIHVVYTQNFVARNKAAKRGARFIGYDGTVEFDFPTAQITVYEHHTGKVEKIDMSGDFGQHFGGDRRLAEAFIRVMEGENSPSTLAEGIQSVSMCLAARESAEKKCMVDVDFSVGK